MTTVEDASRSLDLADVAYLSKILEYVDGETFDSMVGRITIQKKVYLAQVLGVFLGYFFEWNVFGPYSSDLAEDCNRLALYRDDAARLAGRLRMKKHVIEKLSAIRTHYTPPPKSEMPEAAWLELVSSLHMLATHAFPHDAIGKLNARQRRTVEKELLARKPYFHPWTRWMTDGWEVLHKAAQAI